MNAILGRKILQTEIFLANGDRIPVTKIDVANNTVLEIKTREKHGYNAIQIGYGTRKNGKKAILGHVKKANLTNVPMMIREVKNTSDELDYRIGESVNIESVLKPGDIVTVTGTSKGKGFAGVVKRHNFRGGPRTHGQSDRERAPGSIGQTTTPGRVYRGKRMAGRMGHEQSSALNLVIVSFEMQGDRNIVVVKGLVPGPVNSFVIIRKTGKLSEKKFVPVLNNEENDPKEEVLKVKEVDDSQAEIMEDKPSEVKNSEDK